MSGITTSTARRIVNGSTLPATCGPGQVFVVPSTGMYVCFTADAWTLLDSSASGEVTGSGTTSALPKWTNGAGSVVGDSLLTDNATTLAYNTNKFTVTAASGNVVSQGSITTGAAGVATGSLLFKGTTSGTVTVKSADAAGTWSLTLPTNDGDSGQYLQTNGSGVSSWQTVTAGISNSATNGQIGISDGTDIVGDADLTFATDTLSATKVSTPQIVDTNGNEEIKFTTTASAVNELTVANAATGNSPTISATGGDTDIGFVFTPKGAGMFSLSAGRFRGPDGAAATPTYSFTNATDMGMGFTTSSILGFYVGGVRQFDIRSSGALFIPVDSGTLSFGSAANVKLRHVSSGLLSLQDGGGVDGTGAMLMSQKVTAKATAYTVLADDSNTFFTNTGAGAGVTFTMPTPVVGMTYEFYRDANQTVTLDIAAGVTIRVGASVSTDGGNVTLDAVGSRIRLVAISTTQWVGDVSGAATFN